MRSSDHKHGGVYTRELGEKCEIKLDSIQRNRSVAIRVGCQTRKRKKRSCFRGYLRARASWIITIDYSRTTRLVCNEPESSAPPVARLTSASSFQRRESLFFAMFLKERCSEMISMIVQL